MQLTILAVLLLFSLYYGFDTVGSAPDNGFLSISKRMVDQVVVDSVKISSGGHNVQHGLKKPRLKNVGGISDNNTSEGMVNGTDATTRKPDSLSAISKGIVHSVCSTQLYRVRLQNGNCTRHVLTKV